MLQNSLKSFLDLSHEGSLFLKRDVICKFVFVYLLFWEFVKYIEDDILVKILLSPSPLKSVQKSNP